LLKEKNRHTNTTTTTTIYRLCLTCQTGLSTVGKFIDDTAYSEVLTVSQMTNMQTYYNKLQQWSADNFMQVNASKTNEMVIVK